MGLVRPTEEVMRVPPGQALGLGDKIPGPLNLREVGAGFGQEKPSEQGLRGEILAVAGSETKASAMSKASCQRWRRSSAAARRTGWAEEWRYLLKRFMAGSTPSVMMVSTACAADSTAVRRVSISAGLASLRT